jgi:hypothetical protein
MAPLRLNKRELEGCDYMAPLWLNKREGWEEGCDHYNLIRGREGRRGVTAWLHYGLIRGRRGRGVTAQPHCMHGGMEGQIVIS